MRLQENVTMEQIKTFTTMDSHEEKLQKIIMEVQHFVGLLVVQVQVT